MVMTWRSWSHPRFYQVPRTALLDLSLFSSCVLLNASGEVASRLKHHQGQESIISFRIPDKKSGDKHQNPNAKTLSQNARTVQHAAIPTQETLNLEGFGSGDLLSGSW